MSTPVPLLHQPVPGQRSSSNGPRPPRLGLSIPSSPNVRPTGTPNPEAAPSRPPPLRLNPVPGSTSGPSVAQSRRPRLNLAPPVDSSTSLSSDLTDGSRPASLADGGYVSSSAVSPISGHMLARDPASAVPSSQSGGGGSPRAAPAGEEKQMSMDELLEHLDKIKAQLDGREPDVADLDDDGWRAVSQSGRIVELGYLGEGAGGAVTRCILKGGNTVFALKVIPTNPDPDVTRQIVREINFNKQCASDHICRYYGAFLDDSTGTISIAMEFCEGGSLDSVYKELMRLSARAGEKVLQKVAEGVLKGLEYLGQHRIIHRDIKPSNILLCRDGQVKLCDFGVSGEGGTRGEVNTFIGTSYYMAPERITAQSYNINCDVWSLGVSLLEVAQNRHPFAEDGSGPQRAMPIELLSIIVSQPIPKLLDEPEKGLVWSDNMKNFVDCCLEKNPDVRMKPVEMLDHPWMVELQTKKVNMKRFVKEVWDWSD